MRKKLIPTLIAGGAAILLTACSPAGFGGSQTFSDGASLKKRVGEIAKKAGSSELLRISIPVEGKTSGSIDLLTGEGKVGKTLPEGDDLYADGTVPAPHSATIPIDTFPYDLIVKRAQQDLGCAEGTEPTAVESSVTPGGALFTAAACSGDGAKAWGTSWLGEEKVPVLQDPFSDASLTTALAEAKTAIGPELLEFKIEGVYGPFGEEGAGYTFIGPEQETAAGKRKTQFTRQLRVDPQVIFNDVEGTSSATKTFKLADVSAKDLREGLDYLLNSEHLRATTTDELASATFRIGEDGRPRLEVLGKEMGDMAWVAFSND
ncbi:hypothetical protein JD292_03840 [Leucobacter sp. CSA2]|uniref:Lipoprotein n=1 Tax=Leucobacter edaphi TaxID=2796472 RepID=A0A934QAM6_9MICO|nr:hypothetical protein [Leucobacter edaphi]MBK0421214.1 hypothetical protein [Leucobacter edaphi]